MMLVAPPYTCANSLRQSASRAQRQYDRRGADYRTLTLEHKKKDPRDVAGRGTRVRSRKWKQAGVHGDCENVRLTQRVKHSAKLTRSVR